MFPFRRVFAFPSLRRERIHTLTIFLTFPRSRFPSLCLSLFGSTRIKEFCGSRHRFHARSLSEREWTYVGLEIASDSVHLIKLLFMSLVPANQAYRK